MHELHNDYPLALEKLEISGNMFSKYCSNISNKYGTNNGGVVKLAPNLSNKSKYIIRYKNLQLYLSLGMKLVSLHRVLKFKQSNWLKKYINFKIEKIKNAANSFEKDFFKLMNNSTFDKTIENLRKRTNVRLINDARDYEKFESKLCSVS